MPKTFREKIDEEVEREFGLYCQKNSVPILHEISLVNYFQAFLHQSHIRLIEEVERLLPVPQGEKGGARVALGWNLAIRQIKDRLAELKNELPSL